MSINLKGFINSALASFGKFEGSELFEYAVITLFICFDKIASHYRLIDSEVVGFPCVGFLCYNEILKALLIGQLPNIIVSS